MRKFSLEVSAYKDEIRKRFAQTWSRPITHGSADSAIVSSTSNIPTVKPFRTFSLKDTDASLDQLTFAKLMLNEKRDKLKLAYKEIEDLKRKIVDLEAGMVEGW